MNVFEFRDQLVSDYSDYIQSFINIRNQRIADKVEEELKAGLLWPDPLIQLNPFFEPGETIDELVDTGALHRECSRIFRSKKSEGVGKPIRLHRHQSEAIHIARQRANYILTTGTGSGKSLSYIVPIVDHVLRNGSGKGIQAIIVYPMNALANSQHGELQKFLCEGYPEGKEPVTFQRYTGQETEEEKQKILSSPPDIILTNYVMLELILTRPHEAGLIEAAKGLRFLVLDELHTYRGRQGADVALLVRRVRNRLEAGDLLHVGTSATLAGAGSIEQQKTEVAAVASKIFGAEVKAEHVIGETLRRITPEVDLHDSAFVEKLSQRLSDPSIKPPPAHHAFINDPLSIWVESTFGVMREPECRRLIRSKPKTISGPYGAAEMLHQLTGIHAERCADAIKETLLAGYSAEPDPESGSPVFAFRLHQFISRGDTVYSTAEGEDKRYLTVQGQQYVPDDRSRLLFPMVFCRECGHEYFSVSRWFDEENGKHAFMPRDMGNRDIPQNHEAGFLYVSAENPWPVDSDAINERLPDDWIEESRGKLAVKKDRRKHLPETVYITPDGLEDGNGLQCHFVRSPFRFCLNCGVSYGFRGTDFARLTTLGAGGRSSATTILALSTIRKLAKEESLKREARKLLSFTDNRQDASLQAGHFNDFIEVGLLRSALFRAVKKSGPSGLQYDDLVQNVFEELKLPKELYASDPSVKYRALEETNRAFRSVLGYRLYHDLRRGWRVNLPNLEQCGLLELEYLSLRELCEADEDWSDCHPILASASMEIRFKISKTLLDFMRRALAIKVEYLDPQRQDQIKQQSAQKLIEPWAIDEDEKLAHSAVLYPRAKRKGSSDYGGDIFLSPRGKFGKYLSRPSTFGEKGDKLKIEERERVITDLLGTLRKAGLVEIVQEASKKEDVPGFQLPAAAMLWKAGDGSRPFHDPLNTPNAPATGGFTNDFFIAYYETAAGDFIGIEGKEHTAQVNYEDREDREQRFRDGKLPILFCSPTMELGVDISDLNVVNLRNIPPTPANYAQRSGRAGRSGQPALVFSYCTTGSSHDQYFFKRPEMMVAGAVLPPRLDLANEDLLQAHVQAMWLAETGLDLGKSLKNVLNLSGDSPDLKLLPSVVDAIQNPIPRQDALFRSKSILKTLEEDLRASEWYREDWLDSVLSQVARNFNEACNRWRSLYRAAHAQARVQSRIIRDASRSHEDKKKAERLRREAEAQLKLLTDEAQSVLQSDFYSYRYFASEGFLPGYNFPRLPLSAYIPGRKGKKGRNEYLSRPRFLAISEFGPQAIVYHEGARYQINKVILPLSEEEEMPLLRVKLCNFCGYLHPIFEDPGPDRCEHCDVLLTSSMEKLLRLQNVTTVRREKINADEEERLRFGYELLTGFRYAQRDGETAFKSASIQMGEKGLGTLTYGGAATIWRINLGWSRRKNGEVGFLLDTERGYWGKRTEEGQQEPGSDMTEMSARTLRVIPYVEDRRNCLVLNPAEALDPPIMISLAAALKNAIQVHYQLEESELAVELLPSGNPPRRILFYESAEGGAGVLRRLMDDREAFSRVATEALLICHFDPETGEDRKRAPNAREDCEAACYDCLMSYGNQRDHALLDRKAIFPFLTELKEATVIASPVCLSRSAHMENLLKQAESELEREWLRHLEENRLRLPSHAQYLVGDCGTRPDFFYESHQAAIYIDGPPHDYPERHERDVALTEAMEDLGYRVIRFHHREDWAEKLAKHPSVFGKKD
jgi:ATP-dependent helicase YprA (DUF1998 family)